MSMKKRPLVEGRPPKRRNDRVIPLGIAGLRSLLANSTRLNWSRLPGWFAAPARPKIVETRGSTRGMIAPEVDSKDLTRESPRRQGN